jgi:hypothetical protein
MNDMNDLFNWCLEQLKQLKPNYTDDECFMVIQEIVKTNFPVCLRKYLKGEQWKL